MHHVNLEFLLAWAVMAQFSCTKSGSAPNGVNPTREGAAPVPVTVAEAVQKTMPVELHAIGNVRPSATVSIKPRVSGMIASVEFVEGEDVNKGDVLFTIDSKPFEVELAKANAALAQVREQAANAQQQASRYSGLSKTGAVAKGEVEQFQSAAKASASGSQAAEAAVREAEIQLAYCTIKAPIGGRTGRRTVDAGNVVTANTTELVVLNQVEPVEVIFAVAEQHLADITRFMGERKLKVRAAPSGDQSLSAEGELIFVDNTVKQTTGTIDLKAVFANKDRVLWPGQFVDVILSLTTEPNAIVVPAPAVQTGQKGQYVFIVRSDHTVEMRPVEMARTLNDEAVIRTGLAAGESVVTDGHLRLFPGAKVDLKPPVGRPPATPKPARGAAADAGPVATQAP
jgi:multidrug efflux system membrane fusion protein